MNIENKEPKERRLRVLFIDDNKEYLNNAKGRFGEVFDVITVECHTVEGALQAIEGNDPGIIFLDHRLTPGGGEGIEILEKGKELLRDKRIYSTTLSEEMDIAVNYLDRGVEIIGKDLDKVNEIMNKK